MITKTAGELIEGAKAKAGVFNCDFLNFLTLTNELNNAYREVYTEVARSDSDYFVKGAIFNSGDFELPFDLFMIKTVAFVNTDGTWSQIQPCPVNQSIEGHYRIEDRIFHYIGVPNRPILIRYIPTPQTITCPRESEEINIDKPEEYGAMTEKGFYFTRDEKYWYYSFESLQEEEITEEEYKGQRTTYLGKTITVDYEEQTIIANEGEEDEEDWTNIFKPEDLDIKFITFSSPYAFVTYSDNSIWVFSQFCGTKWNIKQSTGHATLGIIHTAWTNDRTLFGVVYEDEDGYLWRASFVPDTVMNYPSNALFNYLEVILARLFLAMNGMENAYVQKELYEQVKFQFYNELKLDHNAVGRIRNVVRRRIQ